MDKTSQLFDKWAKTGRAEEMEKGHGTSVNKFLDKLVFDKPFTFLDIGCGNGWVVRKISQLSNCRKAIGIDKSRIMIKKAKEKVFEKLNEHNLSKKKQTQLPKIHSLNMFILAKLVEPQERPHTT